LGKDLHQMPRPDGKGVTKIGKMLGIRILRMPNIRKNSRTKRWLKPSRRASRTGIKRKMKPAEGLNDEEIKALVAFRPRSKK